MNRKSALELIREFRNDEPYANRRKALGPFGLLMLSIEELFNSQAAHTNALANRHVARAIVCLEDWLMRE